MNVMLSPLKSTPAIVHCMCANVHCMYVHAMLAVNIDFDNAHTQESIQNNHAWHRAYAGEPYTIQYYTNITLRSTFRVLALLVHVKRLLLLHIMYMRG